MAKWYIKEFSKLTSVSVRTLHHYDHIDLLKPSIRLPNDYRLYSEADLLRLQQILALKFFGFSLSQINAMLNHNVSTLEQFRTQKILLQEQAVHLESTNKMLDEAIYKLEVSGSIGFDNIIKLIEVYRMTQELKKTWACQVYNDEQLRQFAELKQQYSEKELADYKKRWEQLIAEIKNNLHQDPVSPTGKRLAKAWMDLLNEVYGNSPELKEACWSAYKEDKIPNPLFDKDVMKWIEKAAGKN